MKAYQVSDINSYYDYSYVVFAETRGKAIRYALDHCDMRFDCSEWTDMRATRRPQLDGFYHGEPEMDWCDMEDRVALVRHAGFMCSDEVIVTSDECEQCAAHEWCMRYDRMMR